MWCYDESWCENVFYKTVTMVNHSAGDQVTHRAGLTPTSSRTRSAMRLWRFQCSTATATINPPINSMLVSFRYCIHT